MRKNLLALLLFLLTGNLVLSAQDCNKTDKQGRRQGLWMDFYANGQKRYEGTFKNDRCTGEFKYYDEQGNLKAANTFDRSGEKALNKTYDPNGTMIATGYYVNRKKDGEWRYFSRENGKLILVEENKDGKVQGNSTAYFENGVVMMERQFVNDQPEGHAKVYYPSGALKEEGDYHLGNKTGIWKTYSEEGDVISSDNYSAPVINDFN